MGIRFAAVAGVAVAVALLAAEAALACSCVYVPPEKQLRRSEGAVIARLLKVRPVAGDPSPVGPARDYIYRTRRVYKGSPRLKRGRRLVVRSSFHPCGLLDDVGHLTGLFLHRDAGRWTASLCSQLPAAHMRRLEERTALGAAAPLCS